MLRIILVTLFALFLAGCSRTPTTLDARTQVKALPKYAFANAPVVDVLGLGPTKTSHIYSEGRYHHLPCGYLTAHHEAPPRVHQLLLGQIVRVISQKPYETLVEVPSALIGSGKKTIPITGWVLNRYLTSTDILDKRKNRDVAFADPHNLIGRKKTPRIALTRPYTISEANLTLSAGTLLPLVAEQKSVFLTHIWDAHEKQFRQLLVPKNVALIQTELSRPEAMRRFIGLLRYWAGQKEGFIPYVLGGGSWTHNYTNKRFSRKGSGKTLEYHREGAIDHIHSGFDCTTLLYNAAQIVGIPYTCRNTTAISQKLDRLKPGETLEAGDLILYPGHVAIITTLKPLRLIQARGYGPGYGRLVEGLAEHHLGGIKTISDLQRHLKEKRPLQVLRVNKKLYALQKSWGIYRFRSCWQQK